MRGSIGDSRSLHRLSHARGLTCRLGALAAAEIGYIWNGSRMAPLRFWPSRNEQNDTAADPYANVLGRMSCSPRRPGVRRLAKRGGWNAFCHRFVACIRRSRQEARLRETRDRPRGIRSSVVNASEDPAQHARSTPRSENRIRNDIIRYQTTNQGSEICQYPTKCAKGLKR
jgi:hypothetical protein